MHYCIPQSHHLMQTMDIDPLDLTIMEPARPVSSAANADAQGLLLKEGTLSYHCSGIACMP